SPTATSASCSTACSTHLRRGQSFPDRDHDRCLTSTARAMSVRPVAADRDPSQYCRESTFRPGPAPVTDALPGTGRTPACPSSHPPPRLSAHLLLPPATTCWSASTPTPLRTPSPSSTPLPQRRASTASFPPAQP